AGRLAALPVEDRQSEWNAFLDGRIDRDSIVIALANAEPRSAPPPRQEGSGEEVARDSSVLSNEGSSPTADAGGPGIRLEPGQLVRALDRDNFGRVVADHGDTVDVHFVSPEGFEAVPALPKSILARPDGSPLGGGGSEPLDEHGWPLL